MKDNSVDSAAVQKTQNHITCDHSGHINRFNQRNSLLQSIALYAALTARFNITSHSYYISLDSITSQHISRLLRQRTGFPDAWYAFVTVFLAVQEVEGISRRNPLSILKEYIDVKGLRLIDLFKQFDKDGSGSVSRVEFIQGLKVCYILHLLSLLHELLCK